MNEIPEVGKVYHITYDDKKGNTFSFRASITIVVHDSQAQFIEIYTDEVKMKCNSNYLFFCEDLSLAA